MKLALSLIGLVGLLLFASAFALTFASPIHFERAGKAFIASQVESQVREKIDAIGGSRLSAAAARLSADYAAEAAELRRKLQQGVPDKVAATIAEMQDLSCECRKALGRSLRSGFNWRVATLDAAQSQLRELMRDRYVHVVQKLLLDLRVFTGTNAFVFALLLALSFLRSAAVAQLFLPAGLLLVATLVSAYFYLFQQNWFFTIIYDDYVGLAYLAYVVVVFLFLADVVLNRARVSTRLINGLLHVLGSGATLAPC